MTTILEPPAPERPRTGQILPPIGLWWPMLERPLQREVLENPNAPLRYVVVRRILELCELDDQPVPRLGVRLSENERAYLAGWTHSVDWD
ncbi:hypothetical protein ABIQ69_05270 [Agromyces sp. G08B096]|uniref:Uncharacterized protein n=1 Tax=Agromyces sp. G08B096 TaxID=3156399 RepID=A0AAU7WA82_9MICO